MKQLIKWTKKNFFIIFLTALFVCPFAAVKATPPNNDILRGGINVIGLPILFTTIVITPIFINADHWVNEKTPGYSWFKKQEARYKQRKWWKPLTQGLKITAFLTPLILVASASYFFLGGPFSDILDRRAAVREQQRQKLSDEREAQCTAERERTLAQSILQERRMREDDDRRNQERRESRQRAELLERAEAQRLKELEHQRQREDQLKKQERENRPKLPGNIQRELKEKIAGAKKQQKQKKRQQEETAFRQRIAQRNRDNARLERESIESERQSIENFRRRMEQDDPTSAQHSQENSTTSNQSLSIADLHSLRRENEQRGRQIMERLGLSRSIPPHNPAPLSRLDRFLNSPRNISTAIADSERMLNHCQENEIRQKEAIQQPTILQALLPITQTMSNPPLIPVSRQVRSILASIVTAPITAPPRTRRPGKPAPVAPRDAYHIFTDPVTPLAMPGSNPIRSSFFSLITTPTLTMIEVKKIAQEIVDLQQDIGPLLENPVTLKQVDKNIKKLERKYRWNSEEDLNHELVRYGMFLELEKKQLENLQKVFQPKPKTNQQRRSASLS